MKRYAITMAVLGMLTAAVTAMAAPVDHAGAPATTLRLAAAPQASADSGANLTEELGRLVHVNLQEATVLHSQLEMLRGNHAARFVWLVMIQDHTDTARRLARVDRKLGGKPDMAVQPAEPSSATADELVKDTLQRRQQLRSTVRSLTRGATGDTLAVLRHFESVLDSQIDYLSTISKGYSLTGI